MLYLTCQGGDGPPSLPNRRKVHEAIRFGVHRQDRGTDQLHRSVLREVQADGAGERQNRDRAKDRQGGAKDLQEVQNSQVILGKPVLLGYPLTYNIFE